MMTQRERLLVWANGEHVGECCGIGCDETHVDEPETLRRLELAIAGDLSGSWCRIFTRFWRGMACLAHDERQRAVEELLWR